jgi:hypothetical protein
MVPIHKRKLVVQKAQEGKLFEIPKSVLTKEGLGQAFKGLGTSTLKGVFSPIGIASLGIGPYQQLKSYAKDKRAELLDQLSSIRNEKKAEEFIKSETGPSYSWI